MRLENDSYYINYHQNDSDKEYAAMAHFIVVWDDGYISDTYGFKQNWMNFEDACWSGVEPNDNKKGKRILAEQYKNWEKRVADCKNQIIKIVKETSTPLDKINEGDYLYLPLNNNPSKEETDATLKYYLLHITNADSKKLEATEIWVDKYDISSGSEAESIEWLSDILDQSMRITKEAYDYAAELIAKTSAEILSEIKKEFERQTLKPNSKGKGY